jgi:DNA-binding MarR family transcriptional regulator
METTVLGEILGSRAAEAVLLHIFHHGESYGRAISADFGLTLFPIQRQLDKFEKAGVLVSKRQGRTLVFMWNEKSRVARRMKSLVEAVYDGLSLDEREKIFHVRRRPRSKDKPVIYRAPGS